MLTLYFQLSIFNSKAPIPLCNLESLRLQNRQLITADKSPTDVISLYTAKNAVGAASPTNVVSLYTAKNAVGAGSPTNLPLMLSAYIPQRTR